jgi:hypothetical protein
MAANVNETEAKYDGPTGQPCLAWTTCRRSLAPPGQTRNNLRPSTTTPDDLRLKSLDPMARRDEPDAVHQIRVTTRRGR